MRARLVQIGNSRGIRIPKPFIEQAGLTEEVEIEVRDGAIVITARVAPREEWAQAAKRMHEAGDDALLDPPTATRFDEEEWTW